jgi:hypothetical protein
MPHFLLADSLLGLRVSQLLLVHEPSGPEGLEREILVNGSRIQIYDRRPALMSIWSSGGSISPVEAVSYNLAHFEDSAVLDIAVTRKLTWFNIRK